ncbi:MAG: 6-phosphogluconolactonase, partial [Coleofasciculus sp. C3-bin4]|nr:6-phosphogluconolactonase [Coleofasciculus sp. C3-bin4]
MNKIVEVLPDKASLLKRSLEVLLSKMQAAIQEHGRCAIALAGGGTPKPLYEALSTQDL